MPMRRPGGAREAPPPYHIRLDDVAVGERIGGGALGEVRVGEHDGNAVALKSLHMLRTDDAAQAECAVARCAALPANRAAGKGTCLTWADVTSLFPPSADT